MRKGGRGRVGKGPTSIDKVLVRFALLQGGGGNKINRGTGYQEKGGLKAPEGVRLKNLYNAGEQQKVIFCQRIRKGSVREGDDLKTVWETGEEKQYS